jgi:uncharacterized protein (TIGR02646 family)
VRTIRKRPPPNALTQWRTPRLLLGRAAGTECNYESLRRDPAILEAVEDALVAEQGGLCAYTGQRVRITAANQASGVARQVDMHIEHLVPQTHCVYGQDADYANIVACWPRPNRGFEPSYGARYKGEWPSPAEQALFISPLQHNCSTRFTFDRRGKIGFSGGDTAAEQTIKRLGLGDDSLTALRREAIRGALNPKKRQIKLTEARKLAVEMDRDVVALDGGRNVTLMPFCFAIRPVLDREIRKLEGIMNRARP